MKLMRILLPLALILGFLLRVLFLDSRPVGLTWDEAALGYNAYSLLKTGHDEHGQAFPVIFKSFGDYKPGLYIYMSVLPTAVLGLNEFSTRLPSAVAGTLTIALIYLLVRQLFPDRRQYAIISLFVAALNPWLIHFSRGAWETNLNLFLVLLATVLFLQAQKKSSLWQYSLSAAFFGLSLWTYQSAKFFTPALMFSLLCIYRQKIKLRKMLVPFLIFLFFLLPVLAGLNSQSGRLKVFSVFSYTRGQDYVSEIMREDQATTRSWQYFLYHSEILDQLRGVFQRYLNHFSPRFLFMEGDWTSTRHSEFRQGQLYLVDFVPLMVGLLVFLKMRSRSLWVLFVWLLLAPIPSALSRDLVSGVRSLPLVVPLIILVSAGISRILSFGWIKYLYLLPAGFLLAYFLEFYFLHAHFYAAEQWVSAYKPAVNAIAAEQANYSRVYFTDQLGQPYIFVLYYLRYDPKLFQQQAIYEANSSGDVGRLVGFGKYNFQPIFWPEIRFVSDAITIGGLYELPEKDLDITGLVRLADIYYPNGALALRAVAQK